MQYKTNPHLIKPGDVYVAIKNNEFDGHNYIKEALNNGAKKIIGQDKNKDYPNYKKVYNTQKYLNKILKKQNKLIIQGFKIIIIFSPYNEENNILYHLLKKLKCRCAYLTPHLLFYGHKKEYFNDFNPLLLNRILQELKKRKYSHLIINITPEQCELFPNIRYNYGIISNLNEKTSKELKELKKATKKVIGPLILCSNDEGFTTFKRKNNITSIGENGDFILNNCYRRHKNTITDFEYQYSKYSLSIEVTNHQIIKAYLLSMVMASILGYDLLDIIKILSKTKQQKKTTN